VRAAARERGSVGAPRLHGIEARPARAFVQHFPSLDACARPRGSPLSEAERKKRKHDLVVQQVIAEAARTMPPERYEEFALALSDPKPPRWAREERDQIWRQIKQQRNARSAARAA
jgi:hypothetical protein